MRMHYDTVRQYSNLARKAQRSAAELACRRNQMRRVAYQCVDSACSPVSTGASLPARPEQLPWIVDLQPGPVISGSKITGMRSWSRAVSSFGVVV
jgi:hypothetical protein